MTRSHLAPHSTQPSRGAIGIGLGAIILCVWLTYRPLWHTDLWGHLAYGRLYDEIGRFPEREPFLRDSSDQPFVTTSWLSQWGGYQLHRLGGNRGLQLCYALFVTGAVVATSQMVRKRSRDWGVTLLAVAIWFTLEQNQLWVMRPQLGGLCCFTWFLVCANAKRNRALKLGLVTIVWANLHGSFLIGPIVLGMVLCVRMFHVATHRSFAKIARDRRIRSLVRCLAVILLASLANPYGPRLHFDALTFSNSPNLTDLIEWKPIWKTPRQGMRLLAVVLVTAPLVLTLTVKRRVRFRWEDWIPAIVIGVKMLLTSRYIVWFTPVVVFALVPYLRFVVRSSCPVSWINPPWWERSVPKGRAILVSACAIAVGCTSLGQSLLQGTSLSPVDSYGHKTPLAGARTVEQLLRENSSIAGVERSLVFNTMEWGDWLIWSSHNELPVFVNSHVTYVRPEVWRDYIKLIRGRDQWRETWSRYPFTVAIIDDRRHRDFARRVRQLADWEEIERDEVAVIFQKKDPARTNR